jgi:hypothetical protein
VHVAATMHKILARPLACGREGSSEQGTGG